MTNQVFGVLTIIICLVGYFYSWKYLSKERFNYAVLLLLICGFILRIYVATDFFLHPYDESFHALVAKHLIQHPLIPTLYEHAIMPINSTTWYNSHIWLHKQPLTLWLMAASMWLFGINEIALRLPSIVFTTIGIYLTYYIGSYLFNKRIGYFAAFLYSISGVIIEMTGGRIATDHVDIFFLFFIELAVFFSILFTKKKHITFTVLTALCIGCAVLVKWLPAFIVIPIWLLIVIDSKQFKPATIFLNLFLLVLICCLVFIPWQVYIFHAFPVQAKLESVYNYKHITEVLDGQSGPFYYYFQRIGINYGELVYLPLLWFLYKTITNSKDLKRWAICIWFLVPFIFFSFAKTKMEGYILFTCPALFIITADFWYMLTQFRVTVKYKWLANIIIFLLVALPVRYCIERLKPFDRSERNPKWVAALKNLNTRNYKNGVLFNYNKPIEAMFYTNLTVYSEMPGKTSIDSLIQSGYTVIINDDGSVPNNILSINGIVVNHLSE